MVTRVATSIETGGAAPRGGGVVLGTATVQSVTPVADTPTAWMAEGSCRAYAPETFFPSDGRGVEIARRICAQCPVATPCLDYALEHRIEHGVWGGASERERRRILKRRRLEHAGRALTARTAIGR